MSIADPRDEQQSHSLPATLTSDGCVIVKSDNLTSVEIVGTELAHSPSRSIIPLEAARHYSQMGFRVLPQIPYSKIPHVKWKNLQTHRGRFPPELIEEWWQTLYPDAGIFLMAGGGSGVCVVDCDGQEAYECFSQRINGIPNTPTAKSGNPDPYRLHFLFSCPLDLVTSPKITPWHTKLEFRGEQGLVVLPPSFHSSQRRYTWLPGRSPDELGFASLPDSIVREWKKHGVQRTSLRKASPSSHRSVSVTQPMGVVDLEQSRPKYSVMNLPGLSRTTKEFLLGVHSNGPGWNDRLFNAACDLVGNRVPIEYATPLLIHGAKPWTDEDHQQAIATIESAYAAPRVSGQILALQCELKKFHRRRK